MKNIFSSLLFLVLLANCKPKPLEIDIPIAPVKLVVTSQVLSENLIAVGVTKTFSPLDQPKDTSGEVSNEYIKKVSVKRAIVVISYDGMSDTLLSAGTLPGIYASATITFKPNTHYSLDVYDPESYLRATAYTYMPSKVNFDTIYPSQNNDKVYINYSFTDPVNEKNYYVVNYYKKNKSKTEYSALKVPFIKEENFLVDWELLNDEGLSTPTVHKNKKLIGITYSDTIAVTLNSITEGHFKFLDAQKRSGNIITNIISEPVNFPTNVVNGYGYFSTSLPDVKIFDLQRFMR